MIIAETKEKNKTQNYLLLASEDDIISTMQEPHDKVT